MGLNYNDTKLLDKYNLSLSCLDYSYIKSATNVKEIENILRVLRSGEEGTYPDLIEFCEDRLKEISPNSKLLQVINQVSSISELPHAEQASLHSDLKAWIDDIKLKEEDLKKNKTIVGENSDYPIRNIAETQRKMNEKEKSKLNSFIPRTKPLSYEEWDKFDINKEMKQIDQETVGNTELKHNDKNTISKEPPLPFIDATGLSESEKQALAEREKTKGNECFKEKDYVNSAFYYSRSISVYPTSVAHCNRAFSHMKLQNYEAAVLDCDAALTLDPHYVKALYRRGLSYKEMGSMQLAYMDFENALKLDPMCKEAQIQLKGINKCPFVTSPGSTMKSLVIEEINSSCSQENKAIKNKISTESSSVIENFSSKNDDSKSFTSSISNLINSSSQEKKRKSPPISQIEAKSTKYYEEAKHGKNESTVDAKSSNKSINVNEQKTIASRPTYANSNLDKSIEINRIIKKESYMNESGDSPEIGEKKVASNSINKLQSNSKEMLALENEKMTPFSFLNFWHNLNAYKDSKAGANILNKISPHDLPVFVTNKLDGDFLHSLISAIKEIITSGDWLKGYAFLSSLMNIPRIKTISLFLSASQRSEIEKLLITIEEKHCQEIIKLKDVMLGKM